MRTFIIALIAAAVAAKGLKFKGWSPKGKLTRCQGDCDSNSHCAKGLKCFERSKGELVPGCSDKKGKMHQAADFCYDPKIRTLIFKGWKPKGKLGRCEGDCDHHKDCAKGLVCQERHKGEKVPGCSGKSSVPKASDYCVHAPKPKVHHLVFKGWKPKGKLGRCEGDCDHHHDCKKGLMCQQRSKGGKVPGCVGHAKHHRAADFCVVRPKKAAPKVHHLVFKGWKPKGKLGRCEGDCDHHKDCKKGLVCQQRSKGQKVPGCVGHAKHHKLADFCIVAKKAAPKVHHLVFKGWKPKGKLGMCEGDCDHHKDCKKGLKCQQRSKGQKVPGCVGHAKHHKLADFCIKA